MTQIYASTVCLSNREPVLKRVKVYRQYGIEAIELGGGVSVDAEALEKLPQLGVNVLLHNYFPPAKDPFYINLSSPSEVIRQRSIDYIIDNIQRSAAWGARCYSFHAGFIADPVSVDEYGLIFDTPPATPSQTEAAMVRFVESLQPLIEQANQHDVVLAIENNICRELHRGQLLLQTASEFMDLFGRITDPYLGVLIDTGHVDVTAQTFGFDGIRFIEILRPFVKAFHVNQNNGLVDMAHPLSPSNPVFPILKTFDVPIINEAHFDHIEALAEHFHWLQQELEG